MRLEAIFFYLSSVIFGSGICKYPQVGISFSVTGRIMGKPSFVLIHLIQPYDAFYMPWDNGVNKNAVIYAAHTTLGVRNMPLTG